MRKNTNTRILKNKVTIKGSFTHVFNRTYLDLYITDQTGYTVASHKLSIAGQENAQLALTHHLDSIAAGLRQFKVDRMVTPKVVEAVVPFILKVIYSKKPTAKVA